MTNRPKQIGTWTESAFVRWCRGRGFAGAERLALHGTLDEGDVSLCPGVMAELKGGKAAEAASDRQIVDWLADTETERAARGADVAFLCWKRKGKGAASAGQWWAAFHGDTYTLLAVAVGNNVNASSADIGLRAYMRPLTHPLPPVRLTLDDALRLLRRAGYGDPLEEP